ncbi:Aste57867_3055 [Aphanomyces stellatus]|uniref:Aste57867_3055 protein n=1 Tax=Aphanomyces stellatus TaxID=120398 RepID=A0A485KAL3_9STRA|nr:hypothetical protein As57867_003046 [Aphanomyces stellatus]VFT80235.1 Aste57867_3055 [Aphanomyces stellatus]
MPSTCDAAEREKTKESYRQRVYRITKKTRNKVLKADVRTLELVLQELNASRMRREPGERQRTTPFQLATLVLKEHNQSLQEIHASQFELIKVLHTWLVSQYPPEGVTSKTSWLDLTLLSHPSARRTGFDWISKRVLHQAIAANPTAETTGVEDKIRVTTHTGHEGQNGPGITGIEIHVQNTFFTNFETMTTLITNAAHFDRQDAIYGQLKPETYEKLNGQTVYTAGACAGFANQLRRFDAVFSISNRAVITHSMVPMDECFPISHGELRLNAYGWYNFMTTNSG